MEKIEVIERLKDLGYTYNEDTDSHSLDFAMSKIEWRIMNQTNCNEIPSGLKYVAIDMMCAEFLKILKSLGGLSQLEFEQIARSVQMGDTNVTFADDSTPEQKFDVAVEYLLNAYGDEILRYRKLVW